MRYKLIHGDCLQVMQSLPGGTVDMVFADPPYHLSNGGFTCRSGQWVSVNKGEWDRSQGLSADHAFHTAWLAECQRLLKPDGTLWVTGTYHAIYSIGYALQTLGYRVLNEICWYKPNASPNLSRRYFTASHETLIWAARDDAAHHWFDYTAMVVENRGQQMPSVWNMPSTPACEKTCGRHPTQKPLSLLRRVIAASTQSGQLVLDPFCGSGTTGVAALQLGRRFVGIDISGEYLQIALRRIRGIEGIVRETAASYRVKPWPITGPATIADAGDVAGGAEV